MARNFDEALASNLRSAPEEGANAQLELAAATIAAFASLPVPGLGEAGELSEIALSDEMTNKLRGGLEPLGFSIGGDKIDDPLGGGFSYTLVQKDGRARRLIRLPDAILKNPDKENLRLVNEVRDGFTYKFFRDNKEIKLYVFYGENPHGAYKLLMEKRWPQYGVRSKFVPLSEVRDLDSMAEELRVQSVKYMFDLEAAEAPAPASRPLTMMQVQQIQNLMKLISKVPEFRDADPGRRRTLAETAGIAKLLVNFDFNGSPYDVASHLVMHLIEKDDCLGSFLKVIRELPDLGSKDRAFLDSLFKDYDL